MRSPALVSAAILIIAPALSAAPPQSALNQTTSNQIALNQLARLTIVDQASSACPVAFSARRQSVTERVAVADPTAPRRAGQGLDLTFAHPANTIRSAEVLVHAASNKLRALPLEGSADPSAPDLSRTFHLVGRNSGSLRNTSLWLEGAGSILSVDLLSITYANGVTWTHQPAATCRAIPSGYLLISSR